ncbi:MAG: translation initiation factor IF-3 [Capsulimonadaceae bacterium]|nr:translation initiation factor IF-3 [Capsulimonadaceae bacterium]
MNERIRHPEIRVVDETGAQLGILPTREALARARERGLDLIEVAPQAQPPVCRIIDYGKYKYEQSKREREAAKKHKQSDLKGIKMFPHIDQHDFDVKLRSAIKFLQDGDKVKVTVAFKGREITHPEFGRMQLEKIIAAAGEIGGQVEKPPAMEGRQMTMILSPRSAAGIKTAAPKPPSAPKPAAPPVASAPSAPPATAAAPAPPATTVAPAPPPAPEAS